MAPDDSHRVSLLPNHYPQLAEAEAELKVVELRQILNARGLSTKVSA